MTLFRRNSHIPSLNPSSSGVLQLILRTSHFNHEDCNISYSQVLGFEDWTGAVADINEDGFFADPTKVKVGERERAEGKQNFWIPPLFDEGGSADQRDSTAGGGQDAETKLVKGVKIIDAENVIAERPRRPRKKRQVVTDASGSSHPPKKLRGDHRSFSGTATGGKSLSVLKELLASSILNVESGVEAVATLPLVTSSISATLERENDSSHHSSTNAAEAGIDSFIRSVALPPVMTEAVITTNIASIPSVSALETGTKVISPVHASMFHDSDSTGTVRPDVAGSSHVPGKELSMGSREINSETLHEVFVLQWNVSNDTLLDDHDASQEFINHWHPCIICSNMMRTEYCLSERKRLESECEKQADLLKARDVEVESLKAQLLVKETEAAKVDRLRAQVSTAEATEEIRADEIDALKQRNVALESEKNFVDGKVTELQSAVSAKDLELKDLNEQIEEFQDAQMSIVNDKVEKLDADLLEMALHLEEKFYPHLEYLTALGSAISRDIEKGMQAGLSASIDHEKAGRGLEDVVAYNLAAEADYNSALPLVDAPRMSDLQPDVEQLTLPIHQPEDQVVLGLASSSGSVPAAIVSTAALSTTFASASSVPPITTDDYEIVNMDGLEDSQGNVASFPTVEFEKEELDTTPERDPPS
ncbi:hypothetical protein Tco_1449505 [Tanacetum coccineum]